MLNYVIFYWLNTWLKNKWLKKNKLIVNLKIFLFINDFYKKDKQNSKYKIYLNSNYQTINLIKNSEALIKVLYQNWKYIK